MPYFDKHFTLEEANAWIPRVKEIFARIQTIFKQSQLIKTSTPSTEVLRPGRTNGKQIHPSEKQKEELKEISDLLTELTDQGIVIQDTTRGLVDFPAFVQGEEVFLCYELQDGDAIRFYHPIDLGYGGRKPIPPEE